MFQMQTCIIFMLLLFTGATSDGLEKMLKLAEFIIDIYHQLPRCCICLVNSEAQLEGENRFYIISINCVLLVIRNVLTESSKGISNKLSYLT